VVAERVRLFDQYLGELHRLQLHSPDIRGARPAARPTRAGARRARLTGTIGTIDGHDRAHHSAAMGARTDKGRDKGGGRGPQIGLRPVVTSQCSSAAFHQISEQVQERFFLNQHSGCDPPCRGALCLPRPGDRPPRVARAAPETE
jgi:hypothetical protein